MRDLITTSLNENKESYVKKNVKLYHTESQFSHFRPKSDLTFHYHLFLLMSLIYVFVCLFLIIFFLNNKWVCEGVFLFLLSLNTKC